jgi:hypothetical protein
VNLYPAILFELLFYKFVLGFWVNAYSPMATVAMWFVTGVRLRCRRLGFVSIKDISVNNPHGSKPFGLPPLP